IDAPCLVVELIVRFVATMGTAVAPVMEEELCAQLPVHLDVVL
ncbi:hypothetical protein NPIL_370491, partial [Nephila pilipes]